MYHYFPKYVPGAVDFVTKEVVTVTNDTYITVVKVCEVLRKVSAEYTGKAIHIALDDPRSEVQSSPVSCCGTVY